MNMNELGPLCQSQRNYFMADEFICSLLDNRGEWHYHYIMKFLIL